MRYSWRLILLIAMIVMTLSIDKTGFAQSPTLKDRDAILGSFQSIFITTQTRFFQPEALQRELYKQQSFLNWDLVMVDNLQAADVVVVVDRPFLTFDYTFKLIDRKSCIVLGAGKIVAIDGIRAAPGIAKQIVNRIKVARVVATQQSSTVVKQPPTLKRRSDTINSTEEFK